MRGLIVGVALFLAVMAVAIGLPAWFLRSTEPMPDIWKPPYEEVNRGMAAFCGSDVVIFVAFGRPEAPPLVAYFLVDNTERPFAVQIANDVMDMDIAGDIFLLDYNRDGRVDVKTTYPSDELGEGPCVPAAKVKPEAEPVPQPPRG